MADQARVVTALGNHGLAVFEAPEAGPAGSPFEVRFRRGVGRPLPGDLVSLDGDLTVAEIAPRHGLFGRGVRGRFRAIAANLDRLSVVIAPEPAPSRTLLYRYLAAARLFGIEPSIIINKRDIPVPERTPFLELDRLDVAVFHTRAQPPIELDGLSGLLTDGIHLLAGQSGVGKTSLANALIPDLSAQTRMLSGTTGKGRHTTTSARLLQLPHGGWLVDTPGVWEYSLWRMTPEELARGFPEWAAPSTRCRFRNCLHRSEPGCEVQRAVHAGKIPEFLLDAWHALLDEQERLAAG
jgi:ribosome biogenesis GTPase